MTFEHSQHRHHHRADRARSGRCGRPDDLALLGPLGRRRRPRRPVRAGHHRHDDAGRPVRGAGRPRGRRARRALPRRAHHGRARHPHRPRRRRPPDGGSEVTVSTTIEGPGADDIGPMVTAEAPLALAALVGRAESAEAASRAGAQLGVGDVVEDVGAADELGVARAARPARRPCRRRCRSARTAGRGRLGQRRLSGSHCRAALAQPVGGVGRGGAVVAHHEQPVVGHGDLPVAAGRR